MTEDTAQSKMRKVRGLLAQAEDPAATPEEAEAFSAKAFELMAAHGIEMAMLESANADEAKKHKPESRTFVVHAPWALDGVTLLHGLSKALRCKAIMIHNRPKQPKQVRVFGFPSDLDRVDVLYTSLLLQMHTGVAVADVPAWESAKAFRKSWLMGFTATVYERVRDAEERAQRAEESLSTNGPDGQSSSTAVVLADRRFQVDVAVSEEYPRLSTTRTSSKGSGYGEGSAAGRRADIGQSRVSGRTSIGR